MGAGRAPAVTVSTRSTSRGTAARVRSSVLLKRHRRRGHLLDVVVPLRQMRRVRFVRRARVRRVLQIALGIVGIQRLAAVLLWVILLPLRHRMSR